MERLRSGAARPRLEKGACLDELEWSLLRSIQRESFRPPSLAILSRVIECLHSRTYGQFNDLPCSDRQPGNTQKFTTNGRGLRLANRLLVYNRKFRSHR